VKHLPIRCVLLGWALSLGACRSVEEPACDEGAVPGELVLNELVANNEGVWIDETGALEDIVEVLNASDHALQLRDFVLSDGNSEHRLPEKELAPGERFVFFADGDAEQGERHLGFKLSSTGEHVSVSSCGSLIDEVAVPALAENESYSRYPDAGGTWQRCRYATPGRSNGKVCEAPKPIGLSENEQFASYEWSGPFPAVPSPVAISELALVPAQFIELKNYSDKTLVLSGYRLRVAPLFPGEPLPNAEQGELIEIPAETVLAPREKLVVPVDEFQLALLSADPKFEGIVSLFNESDEAVDRIDFMHWPQGASLARPVVGPEHPMFCTTPTPGEENICPIVASREIGDRVRGIRTLGDFDALAAGGAYLGTKPVKFVVDVKQGNLVHLLSSATWPLHYNFIREVIEGEESLDRCDPAQRALFDQGWYDFSVSEYFSTIGRSYFLGTLVRHGGSGHRSIEFALGDVILGEDIRSTFFNVMTRVPDPERWAVRPQNDDQVARVKAIEGTLPLIAINAPFADLIYQPLTHGIGYGVLTWVPAAELSTSSLGAQVILVTDDVPNDIPLVGGLITEAFQTPLAHVNVLSQNRGTPNMAKVNARNDPRISEYLGQLVRLTVSGDDFSVELADPEEAAEFWESFSPSGTLQTPRLDDESRELVDLKDSGFADLPRIGAKAAQMAELYQVERLAPAVCAGHLDFDVPKSAFAIPMVHFLEHFKKSGAKALYDEVTTERSFQSDPLTRASELGRVQALILSHPVDTELLKEVTAWVRERFGTGRVRFRSSSNAEDLPGFNGAGLYTSLSAQLEDPERQIDDAMRLVWASLLNARAFDERELANIDHEGVAMGILVHDAFTQEAVNGVGVSRNILDPIRSDIYFLDSQAGEAAVTNPAPGVSTEAVEFQWPPRSPRLTYQSQSSLVSGQVMSEEESLKVACALYTVHRHFRPLLDPDLEDDWFAMEIEYKLIYPSRKLVVKQARPHAFSGFEIAGDCREL
jgi:Pyruvate phosphate dikinase, AMP/ATP-binding domain